MVSLSDIRAAETNIRQLLEPSPLTHSPSLSEICQKDIYLKWDSKLPTGSFKERGAINFLSQLEITKETRGVCASSLGNHALALSRNSERMKIPCTIVMPERAPLVKVERTEKYGAKVILHGSTFDDAREYASEYSKEHGLVLVPPFDHPHIIAGQGTSALELVEQLEDFDAVVVPVGGGGYMSGIAIALKELRPDTKVFGVQSKWSVERRKQIDSGEPLTPRSRLHPPTIADGIAVKGIGGLTKPIMDKLVDQFFEIDENAIASALIKFVENERAIIEGAAATALAAVLDPKFPKAIQRVVLFVCGGNIDIDLLARLIERDLRERGRLVRLKVDLPDLPGSLARAAEIIADCSANIVHIHHDRSISAYPGDVNVTFVLEVKGPNHSAELTARLQQAGIPAKLM